MVLRFCNLYLAGGLEIDPKLCTVVKGGIARSDLLLYSSLEKADDRLMVDIRNVYYQKQHSSVIVYSPDTDILGILINHLKNTWNGMNVYFLRVAAHRTVANKKELQHFPLNIVLDNFVGYVIDQLPAAYFPTGCDTKVVTKHSMLRVSKEDDVGLLTYFGK